MRTGKDWNQLYIDKDTGWDIGYVSTPIKKYIDQLENKDLKILIPGAGNSYEAEYLFNHGFKNVYVLDIAPMAIENFKNRVSTFPTNQLILADFFELNGEFDLIIEQTFFCAIEKNQRSQYVEQVHNLLKPEGKLVGLLFDDPLHEDHPPYGGSKAEYQEYFNSYFNIEHIDTATNSIEKRAGRELWVSMSKKEID